MTLSIDSSCEWTVSRTPLAREDDPRPWEVRTNDTLIVCGLHHDQAISIVRNFHASQLEDKKEIERLREEIQLRKTAGWSASNEEIFQKANAANDLLSAQLTKAREFLNKATEYFTHDAACPEFLGTDEQRGCECSMSALREEIQYFVTSLLLPQKTPVQNIKE